ncbi:MAG: hypothetical protein U9O94_02900 [Nanoarchaeota archaeon]|nr:hypothetical protein [Nanoarchaeota archaeon]
MKKNHYIYGFIALLVVFIIVILMFPGKEESFDIKDRCGPIMNLISHTIQDETACQTQCKSQCGTKDMKYSRVEFEEMELGCHSCTCFCKKGLV